MGLLSKDDLDYYLSQLGAYFAIMLRDNPGDLYKELYSHYDAVREHIQTLEKTNGWISVKERLPESGKHVLATCEIRSLYGYKKQYVCEAYYAEAHSISEWKYLEDTDCYDYSEEDDEYYLKEGWYEVINNWDEYGSVVIEDSVTHWMPLPEPPKEET